MCDVRLPFPEGNGFMVVYFDLDKTWLDVSSGTAWLRAELRAGNLRWRDLLVGFLWLALYHLLGLHVGDPMRMAVKRLKGREFSTIERMAEKVYAESVRGRARPGALAAFSRHRAEGHKIFLLSSSLNLIVEKVAKEYGFDGYLSTELEVNEHGTLTGQIVEPLCFGEGKVVRARAHVAELGATLADCVFYSDSASDLPMLEAAGEAVVINPDIRLSLGARRKGMKIEDWGRTVA